ncbi:hypothetical protein GCM10008967_20600 [Bacillus carboniphilus]|uniref:Uncharacterized protein n=1 Tax=Bacillus carboniphilus TaxID=86663 RepID=A0ABP3G008_9BACI
MKIGRMVRQLLDSERSDELGDGIEHRRIMVSVYYQVEDNWETNQIPTYLDLFTPKAEEAASILAEMGADVKHLKHLSLSSFNNAPISERTPPLPGVASGKCGFTTLSTFSRRFPHF